MNPASHSLHSRWAALLSHGVEKASFFIALWIITSLLLGYVGLLSAWSGIGLALLIFLAWTHWRNVSPSTFDGAPSTLPAVGWWIILAGIIFFGIQHGYDLSGDSAPVIAASLIGETIPFTYQPYADLPFFYPLGLPVILSQLSEAGIPLHLGGWMLGLLGIILLTFFLTAILCGRTKNKAAWVLIPLLITTLRFPLQSLLVGEYPLLLSFGLGTAAWYLSKSKEWESIILWSGAFILHPYGMLVTLAGWILLEWPTIQTILVRALGIGVLTLPVWVLQLLPMIVSSALKSDPGSITLSMLVAQFFLVGIIPSLAAAAAIAVGVWKKQTRILTPYLLLVAVGIGGAGVAAVFPGFVIGGKLIFLAGVGAIGLALHIIPPFVKPSTLKAMGILILIAGLVVTVTSPTMMNYMDGSKATINEARFAEWFRMYDPGTSRVLFLSNGQGKMAQYANKIPMDLIQTHFFTSVSYSLFDNAETERIKQESRAFKQMMSEQCVDCVDTFDVHYIVVNPSDFPPLPNREPFLQKDGFLIYAGNE